VNLVRSLKVSLDELLSKEWRIDGKKHIAVSTAFKAALTALGLKQVPTSPTHAANTLSAIYFPTGEGINASAILPAMMSAGVVAAGGLHKEIKATYFRVGHMSYSVMTANESRDDVLKVVMAMEKGLEAAGVKFETEKGAEAYKASLALASKL